MALRPAPHRALRASCAATTSGLGAVVAHVAAGCAPPPWWLGLVAVLASLAAAVPLTRRRIDATGLTAVALVGQAAFHGGFMAHDPSASHGASYVVVAHAVAAGLVVAVAGSSERAWWRVADALRTFLRLSLGRLLGTPPRLVAVPGAPSVPATRAERVAHECLEASPRRPRGPPVVGVLLTLSSWRVAQGARRVPSARAATSSSVVARRPPPGSTARPHLLEGTMTSTEKPTSRPSRAATAAEERRRSARAQTRREWLIVGSVVAVVAAMIIGALLVTGSGSSPLGGDDDEATAQTDGPTPTVAQAPADDPDAGLVAEVTDEGGIAFGDPAAPHRVVVYEDLVCPFCGQLEATIGEDLAALVDAGDAVVEYRALNFLSRLGPYSLEAANAIAVVLDTTGPGAARRMHDLLFAEQPSESGPQPDADWLVERAVEAGAEESAVRPGIESVQFGGWVNRSTNAASEAGLSSTPTVLVDGEPVTDGATIDELAAAILQRASS